MENQAGNPDMIPRNPQSPFTWPSLTWPSLTWPSLTWPSLISIAMPLRGPNDDDDEDEDGDDDEADEEPAVIREPDQDE
jgi:hypothetical protein